MKAFDLKFTTIASDCTYIYDAICKDGCTVGDFISEVLTNNEYADGYIEVFVGGIGSRNRLLWIKYEGDACSWAVEEEQKLDNLKRCWGREVIKATAIDGYSGRWSFDIII